MMMYWRVDIQLHTLTSALEVSCPGHFTPNNHWIGGWVGPRVGVDTVARRKNIQSLPFSGIEKSILK